MSSLMRSSPEEARLLLNKWMRESVRLVAFISSVSKPAEFVVRLEGSVTSVGGEDGASLFESGDNFIMFTLSNVINYSEGVEIGSTLDDVLAFKRQQWSATLGLGYEHETLVFCAW